MLALTSNNFLIPKFPRKKPNYISNKSSSPSLQENNFPPIKVGKRVVLVRHGQSTWNEQGRIQGSSNFSILTQKGETQADISRQMLLNDTFDVCFASPLARSRRTAEVIWDTRKQEIITDFDLREIDLYSFQGLLKHQGKEKFGEAYIKWQKDAPNFNIDGHYPVRELWDRARNCWTKILDHEGESVLVVAHNAINQALVATAIGLGTEYFRNLIQSNCGVTVLEFSPQAEEESPHVCLNRLNQTPKSPIAAISSGGRKSSKRIILACHGSMQRSIEKRIATSVDGPMDMLGIIQSQKTAELLLDLNVSSVICSAQTASIETAMTISKVQEAADCLGAKSVLRTVGIERLQDLEVESILWQSKKGTIKGPQLTPGWLDSLDDGVITEVWYRSEKVWKTLLDKLCNESGAEENMVVVGHPAVHIALIGHCLNLTKEWMGSFHLDAGSISVIDFPDGPAGSDAHADINSPATSDSGNIHGMPVALLAKLCGNVPGFEYLEKLPTLNLQNIAYIALRDVDSGEKKVLADNNVTAFHMPDVTRLGIKEVVKQVLEKAGTRPIHLSFDIDGIDPKYMPATGTPVHEGISLEDGIYICQQVAATRRVQSFDLVEINLALGASDEDKNTTLSNSLRLVDGLLACPAWEPSK